MSQWELFPKRKENIHNSPTLGDAVPHNFRIHITVLQAASMFQFLILVEIYRELIYLSEAVMDHQNVTAALEWNMRAAPKVMPPILLWWPLTSEVNIGGMTVEVEPFHQSSVTSCCCVAAGSREADWQNGIWHGSAYEAKVCHSIPPCGINGTHWHSSILSGCSWSSNSGMWAQWGTESSVLAGMIATWNSNHIPDSHAQLWPPVCRFLWAQHTGSCSSSAKMHS